MKKILIIVMLAILMPASAFAKSVVAEGIGGSERTALRDAMRLAVEKALGAYIESQSVTKNYTVIKDRINAYAEGYILNYEIIEKSSENAVYRVKIKADVRDDVSNIALSDKERRAKLRMGLKDPRIAVRADRKTAYSDAAENAFIAGLREMGFSRIVNNKNNADYLITININEVRTGSVGSSFTIGAKAEKTTTGEVVFAESESGMGAGAAGKVGAIKKTVKKLLSHIDKNALKAALNPESHITLIITNRSLNMTLTNDYLKNLPGVNNAYIRRAKGNAAEIDIDFTGDAVDFAELLESEGFVVKSVAKDFVKI